MKRNLLPTAALLLLASFLSACGGGGGDMTMTPPVTPPAAKFEDQFAAGFRGGPNTEPTDVAVGDVIPVSATAEPVPFPGT